MHRISVPIEIINLDEDGFHIFTQGYIEDIPCRILIDTGASKSVIDASFSALNLEYHDFEENDRGATGIGANNLQSKIVQIKHFQIGTYLHQNVICSVLPFDHVKETYLKIGIDPFDVILGMDILYSANANIDLKNSEIVFESEVGPQPHYFKGQISQ